MHFNGETVIANSFTGHSHQMRRHKSLGVALAMLFCSLVRNLSFHTGWEESSSYEEAPGWERVPALAAAAHRDFPGLGRSEGWRLRQLLEHLRRQQLLWLFWAFIAQRHGLILWGYSHRAQHQLWLNCWQLFRLTQNKPHTSNYLESSLSWVFFLNRIKLR